MRASTVCFDLPSLLGRSKLSAIKLSARWLADDELHHEPQLLTTR